MGVGASPRLLDFVTMHPCAPICTVVEPQHVVGFACVRHDSPAHLAVCNITSDPHGVRCCSQYGESYLILQHVRSVAGCCWATSALRQTASLLRRPRLHAPWWWCVVAYSCLAHSPDILVHHLLFRCFASQVRLRTTFGTPLHAPSIR